ncbi:hypothetical protein [Flavobacterium sp. FlaQc-47]|uniref:hypothetical protein n=1 Tax=Flavobacterium sp. FlaQc-47 TaxID=3374180 RepID=UPI0037569D67
MKKAIIICILVIGMMANAQTKNQITTKPLQLNTVNKGFTNDSILVWGEDKVVKFIPKSEFSLGATPNIDLEEMITKNGTVTGKQTFKLESNDHITSTYMTNNEMGSQNSSGKVYLRNNALSFSSGGSCIQLSKSTNQRPSTQTFVTMPDNNGQLALRDEFAYDSSATKAISATNLNSDFTNAPNGFKVRTQIEDPSDPSKFIMYEKTSTGWIQYSFKTVNP